MNRKIIGIVGAALYMFGFIVDDDSISIQIITTVSMLLGFVMIVLSFLLLAYELDNKERNKQKEEFKEPFIDELSEFDNSIIDNEQSGWYACLNIAEGKYDNRYKS